MSTEKRLVYGNEALRMMRNSQHDTPCADRAGKGIWDAAHECAISCVNACPTVDAVEVDALKAWLYEIAMNNTDNFLCEACEEIISRLDGLRVFARERREGK